MPPQTPRESLRTVLLLLTELDANAGARLRCALFRLGWQRACNATPSELVMQLRGHYGLEGVEFAEVIVRTRRGLAPAVIARDTAHRWSNHAVWERESLSSRFACPRWNASGSRAA